MPTLDIYQSLDKSLYKIGVKDIEAGKSLPLFEVYPDNLISGEMDGAVSLVGGFLQSKNFVTGSTGWRIDANGDIEGNSGTFRGAISASTIDIGGSDVTSFHVDIDGNMWSGSGTFATGTFKVSSSGALSTNQIINTGAGGTFDLSSVNDLIVLNVRSYVSSVIGSVLQFNHARGTVASPSILSVDDRIFDIRGGGYDGANFQDGVAIIGYVDATPGASDMPGRLVFYTTPDGSATLMERMRITNAGNIVLGTQSALATNASDGFTYIPTCAGAPTGTPTSYTGKVAMVFDTTNNRLYVYDGAWISTLLA